MTVQREAPVKARSSPAQRARVQAPRSPAPPSGAFGAAPPVVRAAVKLRTDAAVAVAASAAAAFPFAAIVGQDDMKTALLIAALDPTIGGVLVLGDRGTGKSTAVRALAALLPPLRVVADCPYGCDPSDLASACEQCARHSAGSSPASKDSRVPMVDLPLGATEDRIVGALDLEKALVQGVKAFQPGLLARANRGFLYVDEVNLLEDHLVDLLIDVAASGTNVVERDGLSVRHPARFVLVGSGNPEEGELRPQLLDRFGLSVEVKTPQDVGTRVEVVRRRDAYERDRSGFAEAWKDAEADLSRQIVAGRRRLETMQAPEEILYLVAKLCMALGTDGLRGELTLLRAARAMASLDGSEVVRPQHVAQMAASCLRHRLRRNPLDDTGSTARVERAVKEVIGP